MAWTVGQVAELAKVSVRTLHHYDEIGLLSPNGRSRAGYRIYEMRDLERLQQVLFFKELGFGLDEIRAIVLDPAFDRVQALRAQRALLAEKARRAEEMLTAIDLAIQADEEGTAMSDKDMFEVFGEDFDPKQYEDEVKERWGDTDAYKESMRRTKGFTKADWQRVKDEGEAVEADFAAHMAAGDAPDSPEVREVVERHRQGIERFYACSAEMHANLARMYVADPRFKKHYDDRAEGLAQYVCDAILAASESA